VEAQHPEPTPRKEQFGMSATAATHNLLSPGDIRRYYNSRVPKLHKVGSELRAPCPIHKGKRDSLAVNLEKGTWFCHSECGRGGSIFQFEAAVSGCDLKHARDEVLRIAGRSSSNGTAKRIVATYDYTDENGNLLFQTVRYQPKDFTQRRPDGRGDWIWNLKGTRRVLYRLPAVIAASVVFVVEGEKDANALTKLGVVATTSPMGAGKWRQEYSESLRGKKVYMIPDADDAGQKHAATVVRSLKGVATSTKLLPLPGANKDAAERIEHGGTLEALKRLMDDAASGKQDTNGHAAQQAPTGPIADTAGSGEGFAPNPYFTVSPNGVFHVDGTFVCSPLRVIARARNADSQYWGLLLEWADPDGRKHSWNMPMELLASDGVTELRSILLRDGLNIGAKRTLLPWYLQSERPERRVIAVAHLGWHNRTFVFPDVSIPEDSSEPVLYQTATRAEHFYNVRGTLDEWRETIGRRCAGNSRLVFAVSSAFAGPMLRPLGMEGGGFHLVGASSSGKSTTEDIAGVGMRRRS
jgi:5S rRNA maturation endonuclease (ribonuclease M5)